MKLQNFELDLFQEKEARDKRLKEKEKKQREMKAKIEAEKKRQALTTQCKNCHGYK